MVKLICSLELTLRYWYIIGQMIKSNLLFAITRTGTQGTKLTKIFINRIVKGQSRSSREIRVEQVSFHILPELLFS